MMEKLVIGATYKHYKGALVKVMGIVQHSETLEEMVHYIHLDNGTSWVRPYDMFIETISKERKEVKRFTLEDPKPLIIK